MEAHCRELQKQRLAERLLQVGGGRHSPFDTVNLDVLLNLAGERNMGASRGPVTSLPWPSCLRGRGEG